MTDNEEDIYEIDYNCSVSSRELDRQQLQADVDEYLSNGGTIEQIEFGESQREFHQVPWERRKNP